MILTNKKLATLVSILSNFSLIVLKLIVGYSTGSVSIISEAIHSTSDLLASFIAFFAVHKAEEPADKEHQFGHGKYEDIAGFIEGLLIILAALYIIYEAGKKLIDPAKLQFDSTAGIVVMAISVIVNFIVSIYLLKVAKKTDSIAIYSDAHHLRTDIFSSLTVLVGLVFIKYTGLHIIDTLLAVIVAMIIMHTGYKICKETLNNLVDGSLPEKDIETIKNILEKYSPNGIDSIKEIRTRKSGKDKEIIIVLLVKGSLSVEYAHNLCDQLESEIEKAIGNTKVLIHIEPTKNISPCKMTSS